jgi:hypothetical protein
MGRSGHGKSKNKHPNRKHSSSGINCDTDHNINHQKEMRRNELFRTIIVLKEAATELGFPVLNNGTSIRLLLEHFDA